MRLGSGDHLGEGRTVEKACFTLMGRTGTNSYAKSCLRWDKLEDQKYQLTIQQFVTPK
jgi:hypothetical protein